MTKPWFEVDRAGLGKQAQEHGKDRLVMPGVAPGGDERREPPKPDEPKRRPGGGNGGGGCESLVHDTARAGHGAADRVAVRWRRDLAVSHVKLGSVRSGEGNTAEATAELRAALEVLDGMVADRMHLDPQAARMRDQLTAMFRT